MAKISKAQGPSYLEGEAGWDGISSSTSSEPDETSTSSNEPPGQSPAPTTENPSSSPQTGPDSSADSTDGGNGTTPAPADPPDDGYDGLLNAELEDELRERDLSTAGNKADMIARLREDDAADENSE